MTMWRVTVAPVEDKKAWKSCVEQGIILIGWPSREWDYETPVRCFREIKRGDLVVAHVPAEYGGGPCMALGVGRVIGDYIEVLRPNLPKGDRWDGDFRRQLKVEWTLGERSLRSVLGYYRGTVHLLSPHEEKGVLRLYGM